MLKRRALNIPHGLQHLIGYPLDFNLRVTVHALSKKVVKRPHVKLPRIADMEKGAGAHSQTARRVLRTLGVRPLFPNTCLIQFLSLAKH